MGTMKTPLRSCVFAADCCCRNQELHRCSSVSMTQEQRSGWSLALLVLSVRTLWCRRHRSDSQLRQAAAAAAA